MGDGYIGMFRVPEAGAIIPYTNDASNMTMEVLEDAVQNATGTTSNAIIDISNVDILTSGAAITEVVIQHRLVTDPVSAYDNVGSYNVQWYGLDNTDKFVFGPVSWSISGIEHDFRAYFQNADGQLAIQDSDDQVIGIDVFVEDTIVDFNGFDDLAEYPSVLNLVADNASSTEGGTFASPAVIPGNGIIRLSWKDMKTQAVDIAIHPFADGSTDTVTVEQWKNIVGYKVFMYIAVPVTGSIPDSEFPDPNEDPANGTWYLVGETQDSFSEVDCPKADKICFWVGAVIRLTSGESDTDIIEKAKYNLYAKS
jgi:hypothetical protein